MDRAALTERILRFLDGEMPEAEQRALAEELCGDAEARKLLLQLARIHGNVPAVLGEMEEKAGSREAVGSAATGLHADVKFATGLQKLVKDRERSEHIRKSSSRRHMSTLKAVRRKLWLPALLAACVLAGVTVYLTVGRGSGVTRVSPAAEAVGKVIYVTELVKSAAERPVLVRGGAAPKELSAGMELRPGDRIQTRGKPGLLAPVAQTQLEIWSALVDLAEATDINIAQDTQDPCLNIEEGLLYVETPASLHVQADFADLLIDAGGAHFEFSVRSGLARLHMQSGSGSLQGASGARREVKALQECEARKGMAASEPQKMLASMAWQGRKVKGALESKTAEAPLNLKWNFSKGPAPDLKVLGGAWAWARNDEQSPGFMRVASQMTHVLLPAQAPAKPFVVTAKFRETPMSRWSMGAHWGSDKPLEFRYWTQLWKRPLGVPYVLRVFFTGRYAVSFLHASDENGFLSRVCEFTEAYPADQVFFTVQNVEVEEFALRSLGPEELPAALIDPGKLTVGMDGPQEVK